MTRITQCFEIEAIEDEETSILNRINDCNNWVKGLQTELRHLRYLERQGENITARRETLRDYMKSARSHLRRNTKSLNAS